MLNALFERFVEQSSVTVMTRTLLERVFAAPVIDALFDRYAEKQYTREVLFSSIVGLMSLVVCGIQKSVRAAYNAQKGMIPVSLKALYNKLERVETQVSRQLVIHSAEELAKIRAEQGIPKAEVVAGLPDSYEVKILDGNAIAGTDRRLGVHEEEAATPLPGKALVVYDPQTDLVSDIFPCEDAHAQERSLIGQVLETVKTMQLWVADSNFCTYEMLTGAMEREAFFLIRQHGNCIFRQCSELISCGRCDTGEVFEQQVAFEYQGIVHHCRRIIIQLDKPTRNGEKSIALVSNLPQEGGQAVSAMTIAVLYRRRWKIETLFQVVTKNFEGEIKTLAYPKAAVFSHCLAFCAYNILSTVRKVIAHTHNKPELNSQLSDYYLVDQITGNYRGMMIAIPEQEWSWLVTLPLAEFTAFLQHCAQQVKVDRFLKAPSSNRKKPKRPKAPPGTHVSTARLLEAAKRQKS